MIFKAHNSYDDSDIRANDDRTAIKAVTNWPASNSNSDHPKRDIDNDSVQRDNIKYRINLIIELNLRKKFPNWEVKFPLTQLISQFVHVI